MLIEGKGGIVYDRGAFLFVENSCAYGCDCEYAWPDE